MSKNNNKKFVEPAEVEEVMRSLPIKLRYFHDDPEYPVIVASHYTPKDIYEYDVYYAPVIDINLLVAIIDEKEYYEKDVLLIERPDGTEYTSEVLAFGELYTKQGGSEDKLSLRNLPEDYKIQLLGSIYSDYKVPELVTEPIAETA